MTNTRITITITMLAAAGLLALTGCGTPTTTATPATPTTDYAGVEQPTGPLPTGSVGPDGIDAPLEINSGVDAGGLKPAKWGAPLEAEGFKITVGAPATFVPTADAYPSKYAGIPSLKVKVTLVNVSGEAQRPYDAGFSATVMDSEVSPITDYDSDVGRTPGALVLPGREVSYWLGYATAANDPAFAVQGHVLNTRAGVWSATG